MDALLTSCASCASMPRNTKNETCRQAATGVSEGHQQGDREDRHTAATTGQHIEEGARLFSGAFAMYCTPMFEMQWHVDRLPGSRHVVDRALNT